MRVFLIFLLAICPILAGAATRAEFDESVRSLPLGQSMYVFEDVPGNKSIDDITSPALQGSFRLHDKPVLNAGYSRSVFWLRLDLQYLPHQPDYDGLPQVRRLLELAYPPLDHLEFYELGEDGHYHLTQRTGDALPFASRPIRQNNYLFPLFFEENQLKRVYLRIESQGSIQAPLTLWSPTAYLEEQPARIYVLGIIYGVLLVMLIYNLFIFVSVRDTSYLYYILYIASFGLYQVSVNGAGIEFFWPDNPWWANAATPFLIGASALFGSQFARSFLQTGEHSRWVDRSLLLLMLWGIAVMALALTASYALSLRLATLLALVFTVVVALAGVLAWLRGMRVARYFIIAWAALLIGGVVNTLMVLGHLPNVFLTMYASQIGSALEVALLSLALADRINAMKEDRERILQSASEKLEQLNRELADSNRLKDDFLATISHELRTPMNGVIGSLELMQTLRLDAEAEQYQKTAASSARDMMQMVNEILALTELQAGRLYPRREAFSLRGMLDGLCAGYGARAQEKGLAFTLDMDARLPDTLEGDSGKLAQALGYLLDNAIKFTHSGQVCLRVRAHAELAAENLPLSFEVIDTGIGLQGIDSTDLYRHFYQRDTSNTRQYGGLGIGLPICRQLVELLGGQLEHQANPAGGSIFCLRLNLVLPAQKIADEAAQRPASGPLLRMPEQCTVLVVEDNAINQLVIRGMLLKLGYRVRTADNGAEALVCLQAESVDVVLLDCQMPVMDGFATCRALRLLPGCVSLPVLAVTANSQEGDRERCLAVGMNDYLAKPVKFEELRMLLQQWVLCRAS